MHHRQRSLLLPLFCFYRFLQQMRTKQRRAPRQSPDPSGWTKVSSFNKPPDLQRTSLLLRSRLNEIRRKLVLKIHQQLKNSQLIVLQKQWVDVSLMSLKWLFLRKKNKIKFDFAYFLFKQSQVCKEDLWDEQHTWGWGFSRLKLDPIFSSVKAFVGFWLLLGALVSLPIVSATRTGLRVWDKVSSQKPDCLAMSSTVSLPR